MANHALWDESPADRFRKYEQTHDGMMRLGDEPDPTFTASDHKAAAIAAGSSIALLIYFVAWGLYEIVKAVLG